MEIHPVGAELFYEDGRTERQTDMTKKLFVRRIKNTQIKVKMWADAELF
jgi:hypothetical protein